MGSNIIWFFPRFFQIYNKLRRHIDIRYEVQKIERTSDKVLLLIQVTYILVRFSILCLTIYPYLQAILGGISLSQPEYRSNDSQPHLEAYAVFRHLPRIARGVYSTCICCRRGTHWFCSCGRSRYSQKVWWTPQAWPGTVSYNLVFLFEQVFTFSFRVRCFTAKAWEDRPIVLRQIESIGEKSFVHLTAFMSFYMLTTTSDWRLDPTVIFQKPWPSAHKLLGSGRTWDH